MVAGAVFAKVQIPVQAVCGDAKFLHSCQKPVISHFTLAAAHQFAGTRDEQIDCADSFATAQARLVEIARAGDVVLYENDLPDTFK